MPLIAHLCPHLETLMMADSDVIEPILRPINQSAIFNPFGQGQVWSGGHVRNRGGEGAIVELRPPAGGQASSCTQSPSAVAWPALEHLFLVSCEQYHGTDKFERIGRERVASTLPLLSSAPRLRVLFLDLVHGVCGDYSFPLSVVDMCNFAEQLPSLRSIGDVDIGELGYGWVRRYERRGEREQRRACDRSVAQLGSAKRRHRIEQIVAHNVRIQEEDGTAERLHDMLDAVEENTFRFELARLFDGCTGREAFLQHAARNQGM